MDFRDECARKERLLDLFIRSFDFTPEIARLLKSGDRLGMIAGLSQGRWRLIAMKIIATPSGEADRFHVSIMNPLAAPRAEH